MVADTNKAFGCYVGYFYEMTGVSDIAKAICAPIEKPSGSSPPYVSAAFCKVRYYMRFEYECEIFS